MSKAILYCGNRNASSWTLRAWLALRQARIPFDEVMVDIRRPQRFVSLGRVGLLSPSATVPALEIDGRTIFDSIAIMEYANDGSHGRLLPTDPLTRAEARSFVGWQHAGLSRICERISFESAFYPYRRVLTQDEQREAGRFFDAIEPYLTKHGGPWLFGEESLADYVLAPTAIRLLRHNANATHHSLSEGWMNRIMAQPNVAEWVEEADRQPHVWLDEYLVPGQPIALTKANNGEASSFFRVIPK